MEHIFQVTHYMNYYHSGKILANKPFYTKAFKDTKGIILCYEDFNNGFKLQ